MTTEIDRVRFPAVYVVKLIITRFPSSQIHGFIISIMQQLFYTATNAQPKCHVIYRLTISLLPTIWRRPCVEDNLKKTWIITSEFDRISPVEYHDVGSYCWNVITGSENGLAPNSRQAIIYHTNDDPMPLPRHVTPQQGGLIYL